MTKSLLNLEAAVSALTAAESTAALTPLGLLPAALRKLGRYRVSLDTTARDGRVSDATAALDKDISCFFAAHDVAAAVLPFLESDDDLTRVAAAEALFQLARFRLVLTVHCQLMRVVKPLAAHLSRFFSPTQVAETDTYTDTAPTRPTPTRPTPSRLDLTRPAAGFVFARLAQLADALMTGDDARYLITPAAAAAVAVTPDAAAAVAAADGAALTAAADTETEADDNDDTATAVPVDAAPVRLKQSCAVPVPQMLSNVGPLVPVNRGAFPGLGRFQDVTVPNRFNRAIGSGLINIQETQRIIAGPGARPVVPIRGSALPADTRNGTPRPAAMAALVRFAPLPHRPLTAAAAVAAKSGSAAATAPAAAPLFPHPDDALLWCSCDAFCAAFLAHSGAALGHAGGDGEVLASAWLERALGGSDAEPRAWPHAVAAAVLLRFNALRVAGRRAAMRSNACSGVVSMSTERAPDRPLGCFASKPLVAVLPALLALAHKPPAPAADGAVNAAAARAHRVFVYVLLQTLGQLDPGAAGMPWAAAEAARDDLASAPGAAEAAALALRVVATAADGGALLHALSFLGLLLPRQRGALKEADVAAVVALLQKLLPRSEADVAAAVDEIGRAHV